MWIEQLEERRDPVDAATEATAGNHPSTGTGRGGRTGSTEREAQ